MKTSVFQLNQMEHHVVRDLGCMYEIMDLNLIATNVLKKIKWTSSTCVGGTAQQNGSHRHSRTNLINQI